MKYIVQVLVIGLSVFAQTNSARAQSTLNIGYFAEWPLPAHYGRTSGAYDEVLGQATKWTAFSDGTAMSAALEAGEIQIALSQGLVPFLLVATARLDFKIVDIAVSYPANDGCVAHPDLNYSAKNSTALTETTIALPVGTTTHFDFNQALASLNIDQSTIEMINMPPAQAAAALMQGKVDIACGWGPALDQMRGFGTYLLKNEDKSAGLGNYDVIVIRTDFGTENPVLVAKFLKVTADLNAAFMAAPDRMIGAITAPLSMTKTTTTASMTEFQFTTITAKTSSEWLGGGVQSHLGALAEFFVQQGTFDHALESYASYVDPSYLHRALDLPLIDAE